MNDLVKVVIDLHTEFGHRQTQAQTEIDTDTDADTDRHRIWL